MYVMIQQMGPTYRSIYRSKPGLCHYIHTFARRCFLQFAGRSCLPGRCQRRAYNYQRHGGNDIDHSRIAPGSERELVCSPLSALVPTPGRSFCPLSYCVFCGRPTHRPYCCQLTLLIEPRASPFELDNCSTSTPSGRCALRSKAYIQPVSLEFTLSLV